MHAPQLNQRIEILRRTVTRDAFGAEVETWATLAIWWADVRDVSARELLATKQTVGERLTRFTVRKHSDVTVLDRVRWSGRTLGIEAIVDPDGMNRWTEITARQIL